MPLYPIYSSFDLERCEIDGINTFVNNNHTEHKQITPVLKTREYLFNYSRAEDFSLKHVPRKLCRVYEVTGRQLADR